MRTYTVRDVRGDGRGHPAGRRLRAAPRRGRDRARAPRWAAQAAVGDRLVTVAPRRGRLLRRHRVRPRYGAVAAAGRPTRPPSRRCADPRGPAGVRPRVAFLEVPESRRRAGAGAPAGCEVVWLPRDGAPLGDAPARGGARPPRASPRGAVEEPEEVDPDLWETPTYSSSGEDVEAPRRRGPRPRRALRLDRRGVRRGHHPAPAPGQASSAWTAARSPSWATGGAVSRCAPEVPAIVRDVWVAQGAIWRPRRPDYRDDLSCRSGRRAAEALGEAVPLRGAGAAWGSAARWTRSRIWCRAWVSMGRYMVCSFDLCGRGSVRVGQTLLEDDVAADGLGAQLDVVRALLGLAGALEVGVDRRRTRW